ncbi:multicopper oxidase family protein [Sulfurovum lithotrophicum]|nr:multicopper oxidase domain-containing protein [Sulfurovum lithotrophicum]
MMKRRKFITISSAAAVWVLTGCGGGGNSGGMGNDNPGNGTPVGGTLPIPELLEGKDVNGVLHYDLDIVNAQHSFFEGIQTATYAISGTYLGPTLLLKNGMDVSINYTNKLDVETTMHGHGMHVPGKMDGTAHQPIAVGARWSASYRVQQNACTNWYHPHYLHKTAPHVYQGLAGMIIIEDSESQALDIPKRYGIDDIPLVLQDRFFSADKTQLDYSPSNMQLSNGYIGDTFITNGAIEPTFDAEAKEIRFRLLNGSNSTVYELGFSNGKNFRQIASDNAFLEKPVNMNRIILSPGERAEIVVDFTDDTGASLRLEEYRYSKTFLKININKNATAVTSLPAQLTTLDPVATPTNSRQFRLGMAGMGVFTINDKTMDMNRIDAALSQGDVEEWEVINDMGVDHNFHIHGTHFRVVSRNGSTAQVLENEKGYKDVVYLPANETLKFIVEIPADGVTADSNNPYMFHCHFLEHEDNGMMGQFTVS